MFQVSKLIYECFMIMLMLCKSSYARLTPRVLQQPRAPLRNGAGDLPSAVKVTMADDDDVVYPLTGNDDLIAYSLGQRMEHTKKRTGSSSQG